MLKGILLKTDGTYQIVDYEDKLEVLQEYVGGLIDYVSIGKGIDIIVNDEGKIYGMDFNYNATSLYRYDMIVGDALVVRVNDEGENVSLTDDDIKLILEEIGE